MLEGNLIIAIGGGSQLTYYIPHVSVNISQGRGVCLHPVSRWLVTNIINAVLRRTWSEMFVSASPFGVLLLLLPDDREIMLQKD